MTGALAILLYGELNTKAHDKAKKHNDQPMGRVIFNGILVNGYWAVREKAEDSGDGFSTMARARRLVLSSSAARRTPLTASWSMALPRIGMASANS